VIVVVADAGPVIALQRIGHLGLLQALFQEVLVPPAVARELVPRLTLPAWIRERTLQQPIAQEVLRASLGAGESEAISLALEIQADRLIVDERAGRRVAEALGLRVAGVLGLLVLSKQRGHVTARARACRTSPRRLAPSHGFPGGSQPGGADPQVGGRGDRAIRPI
jgi:predicted nucleic acid-binding protein